jgi:arabinogalactan oligomer / maltooligosaccharide transport system permease protein
MSSPTSRQSTVPWLVRNRRQLEVGGRLLLALIAIVFALTPVLMIVTSSLDPRNTLSNQRLIPLGASLENYRELFSSQIHPYGVWFWNTMKIAVVTSSLTVLICSISAFAFSRFRFKGRRGLLLSVFLIQVFPNTLTMVATFLLIQAFGLFVPWLGLNSHGGLILVYLGGAMGINTWLMKGYFDTVPRSLDESAKMDGASNWQVYWRILLPVVTPVLTVVGLLSFIAAYSDFLIPQIILQDTRQFTLAVGLTLFIRNGDYSESWGVFAAGALIGAVPIVTLYLFLQNFLVRGLTSGAVKG